MMAGNRFQSNNSLASGELEEEIQAEKEKLEVDIWGLDLENSAKKRLESEGWAKECNEIRQV